MRLVIVICFIFLLSCSKKDYDNKIINIDINENLTFEELKNLIEKKSLTKDYPDIDK